MSSRSSRVLQTGLSGLKTTSPSLRSQSEIENGENVRSENQLPQKGGSTRKSPTRRAVRGGRITSGLTRRAWKETAIVTSFREEQKEHKDQDPSIDEQDLLDIDRLLSDSPTSSHSTPSKTQKPRSLSPKARTREELQQKVQEEEKGKTASLLSSKAVLFGLEALLLVVVVLFMSPSYQPPSASSKPFFHSVHLGDTFSFDLEIQGSPPPHFQWRLNGVDIVGANQKKLEIPSVQMDHSGTYTCLIENVAGSFVWEEGYLNVIHPPSSRSNGVPEEDVVDSGDNARVKEARRCLMERAPSPVKRSASLDGGASVIAAGEMAGYLECFQGLKTSMQEAAKKDSKVRMKQVQALDMLRALHGSSKRRMSLVNVVAALDDLATAKWNKHADSQQIESLTNKVVFEAGLFCASAPQCDASELARERMIQLLVTALAGFDSNQ